MQRLMIAGSGLNGRHMLELQLPGRRAAQFVQSLPAGFVL